MSTLTTATIVEDGEPMVIHQLGSVQLWVSAANDGAVFLGENDIASWQPANLTGLAQLRDLAALLSHPTIAALLNV